MYALRVTSYCRQPDPAQWFSLPRSAYGEARDALCIACSEARVLQEMATDLQCASPAKLQPFSFSFGSLTTMTTFTTPTASVRIHGSIRILLEPDIWDTDIGYWAYVTRYPSAWHLLTLENLDDSTILHFGLAGSAYHAN